MKFTRLDSVVFRSVVTLVVAAAIALSPWSPEASVSSAAEMPIGATLKVLALPVEVQFGQTDSFAIASDGQMLGQGDVVRTGPDGLALLTFFDGSETQLGAESQVQIMRAEATPAPQIALLQTSGVTMNHVVPMPPGGSFSTDTPAATGLVRGTSYVVVVGIGASQSADDQAAADQQPSGDTGAVQLAGDDMAAGQTVLMCGPTGDQSCATSVVLLTDRDGHVGRVDVAAHGSVSADAPLQLTRAGDAAASNSGHSAAARVAPATLLALEAGANARYQPQAVREAEYSARLVAAALVLLTVPTAKDQDGNYDVETGYTPAGVPTDPERPGAVSSPSTTLVVTPSSAASGQPNPVAPVSSPVATPRLVPTEPSGDNNASGQVLPLATVRPVTPAPTVRPALSVTPALPTPAPAPTAPVTQATPVPALPTVAVVDPGAIAAAVKTPKLVKP